MKKISTLMGTAASALMLTANAAVPVSTTNHVALAGRESFETTALPGVGCGTPAEAEGEWKSIGKGKYTDLVFGTLGLPSQTLEVEFEQNSANTDRYRMVNPYKSWENPQPTLLTYDSTKDHYIEFEVINNQYVYFFDFSTGYTLDMDGDGGEIAVKMNASSLYNNGYTLAQIASGAPASLARYEEGNITAEQTFKNGTQSIAVFVITFSKDTKVYMGNINNNFSVVMPGAKEIDPNEGWEKIGNASFTEVFVSGVFENIEPQILQVEAQRNKENPAIYRLVNPYLTWENSRYNLSYSSTPTRYLVINTEKAPDAWFDSFESGILYSADDGGMLTAGCQAGLLVASSGYAAVKSAAPDCFGTFVDGTLTFPNAMFDLKGAKYPTLYSQFSKDSQGVFTVNKENTFKVVLPATDGVDMSLADDNESPAVYYTLQGIRIDNPEKGRMVIRVRNGKSSKVLMD